MAIAGCTQNCTPETTGGPSHEIQSRKRDSTQNEGMIRSLLQDKLQLHPERLMTSKRFSMAEWIPLHPEPQSPGAGTAGPGVEHTGLAVSGTGEPESGSGRRGKRGPNE